MLEDETDGTMRHIGAIAALVVLKALVRAQNEKGWSRSPTRVADTLRGGARLCQVGDIAGAREGALDVETPNRSEGRLATGTRPARGHECL